MLPPNSNIQLMHTVERGSTSSYNEALCVANDRPSVLVMAFLHTRLLSLC